MIMHSKTNSTLSSIHTYALPDLSKTYVMPAVMSGDAALAGLSLCQPNENWLKIL